MLRTLTLAGAALALLACAAPRAASVPADPALARPAPTALTAYLPPGALDGRRILPPPPAAGSPQDLADRTAYETSRALRDTPRWREAIQDNDLWTGGALQRMSCTLGVELSPRGTPATWRVLNRIALDVRDLSTPAKDHFARKRPALGNDLPICVPREAWLETNSSYPSGHAMVGWAWALVMTQAAPAQADALLALGREMGESRVVCGVHYPSDIEAGRTLGAAMVARLQADPGFQAEFAALKAELAATRAPPPSCPAS